jgi:hypothetical protein
LIGVELAKQKLPCVEAASLTYIDRTSGDAASASRMNDLAAISTTAGKSIGVTELKDGITSFLAGEMTRLRKRGYRFVRVSQLLSGEAAQEGGATPGKTR